MFRIRPIKIAFTNQKYENKVSARDEFLKIVTHVLEKTYA